MNIVVQPMSDSRNVVDTAKCHIHCAESVKWNQHENSPHKRNRSDHLPTVTEIKNHSDFLTVWLKACVPQQFRPFWHKNTSIQLQTCFTSQWENQIRVQNPDLHSAEIRGRFHSARIDLNGCFARREMNSPVCARKPCPWSRKPPRYCLKKQLSSEARRSHRDHSLWYMSMRIVGHQYKKFWRSILHRNFLRQHFKSSDLVSAFPAAQSLPCRPPSWSIVQLESTQGRTPLGGRSRQAVSTSG